MLRPIWAVSAEPLEEKTQERQFCEESSFQPLVDLEAALPNVTATISGLAGVKVSHSMNN